MKIKINRLVFVVMAIAILFTLTVIAAERGERTAYNWYCKNNDNHKQPELGADLSFICDYNGCYINTKYGDDNSEKVLYLTFDAGYENGNIAKILDVLHENEVRGAFFVLENLIKHDTELVKRMADEGHLVCNHTMHHRDMSKMNKENFTAELTGLETLYRDLVGSEMAKFYRPPEGRFSQQNLCYASELGYKTVFWSFAYADWDNDKQMSPSDAKAKILAHTHNGAVILLHPTSATNAAIMAELIAAWREEGYRFGTLDELVSG